MRLWKFCNKEYPPRLRDMMLHHDIAAQKLSAMMRVPQCKGKQDTDLRSIADHHILVSPHALFLATAASRTAAACRVPATVSAA